MPVSVTVTATSPAVATALIVIFPPAGVYFVAHELAPEPIVRHLDLDVDALTRERAYEVGLDGLVGVLAQDLRDPPADQIRGLQAEPRRVRPVDELEAVLEIAVRNQHRGAVGDESQLPFALSRGFLGGEPERGVAVDFEDDVFAACSIQGPA
jgi:hypothetical protein